MKIGVIGGGQLGRMMALAGIPLGHQFIFIDPSEDPCAADVGELIKADFDDVEALSRLAETCDVVTFEFENVPANAVAALEQHSRVYPSSQALETARDRLNEKTLFQRLDIPTAPFYDINSQEDVDAAIEAVGIPCILKTRTLGYDGKGQKLIRTTGDAAGAYEEMGQVPLLAEGFVNFSHEVSQVATRSSTGEIAFYPLSVNVHRDGILHSSIPDTDHASTQAAQVASRSVMEALGYVGTLAIEFFVENDQLIANEMAPRVHNSGHWTQDGAACCQFENHIRAISHSPLGATELLHPTGMLNAIGSLPDQEAVLALPGAHLHSYRKAPRAGRKVGHINCVRPQADDLKSLMLKAEALLK